MNWFSRTTKGKEVSHLQRKSLFNLNFVSVSNSSNSHCLFSFLIFNSLIKHLRLARKGQNILPSNYLSRKRKHSADETRNFCVPTNKFYLIAKILWWMSSLSNCGWEPDPVVVDTERFYHNCHRWCLSQSFTTSFLQNKFIS